MTPESVTVIITAYNAAATIGRAIRSALASSHVERVIVIDDASTDATARTTLAEEDGSGRLLLIETARNGGPAAGRNYALGFVHSPLVALLDADDYFLPGRFERLMREPEWDFIADNILFQTEEDAAATALPDGEFEGRSRPLALEEFVRRNISLPGKARGELGFLKPVMRRDFLERHALRYDEGLRLGEDFILYAEALAKGARFRLVDSCGYVAIERSDSLSSRHRTEDLEALASASRKLAGVMPPGPARAAMAAHNRALEVRARHRRLLDDKARHGAVRSLGRFLLAPQYLLPVSRAIYADKRGLSTPPARVRRFLFSSADFEAAAPAR